MIGEPSMLMSMTPPQARSTRTRDRPGIIDTEIHASGGMPDRIALLRDQLPMKREGTAREVAQAIAWLLSDEASYTNGTVLNVTGGR